MSGDYEILLVGWLQAAWSIYDGRSTQLTSHRKAAAAWLHAAERWWKEKRLYQPPMQHAALDTGRFST